MSEAAEVNKAVPPYRPRLLLDEAPDITKVVMDIAKAAEAKNEARADALMVVNRAVRRRKSSLEDGLTANDAGVAYAIADLLISLDE